MASVEFCLNSQDLWGKKCFGYKMYIYVFSTTSKIFLGPISIQLITFKMAHSKRMLVYMQSVRYRCLIVSKIGSPPSNCSITPQYHISRKWVQWLRSFYRETCIKAGHIGDPFLKQTSTIVSRQDTFKYTHNFATRPGLWFQSGVQIFRLCTVRKTNGRRSQEGPNCGSVGSKAFFTRWVTLQPLANNKPRAANETMFIASPVAQKLYGTGLTLRSW
jgi:hypothetical protein